LVLPLNLASFLPVSMVLTPNGTLSVTADPASERTFVYVSLDSATNQLTVAPDQFWQ
jgi:hypothetical protein